MLRLAHLWVRGNKKVTKWRAGQDWQPKLVLRAQYCATRQHWRLSIELWLPPSKCVLSQLQINWFAVQISYTSSWDVSTSTNAAGRKRKRVSPVPSTRIWAHKIMTRAKKDLKHCYQTLTTLPTQYEKGKSKDLQPCYQTLPLHDPLRG